MTTDSSTVITIVLGTRPEIIKFSPIIRACERLEINYSIVHTGQHYSDELDSVFFDQLDLPQPESNLEVGSYQRHGQQTAEMIAGVEDVLLTDNPDVVLVQGDTNSVLACSIATSKLDCELGHVEAGLRSFDSEMPEETNRVVTDHVADYLFAPTENAAELLEQENIDERVVVTGNTIVDAVQQNRTLANEKSRILDEHGLSESEYGVMTAHREENVDDEERFAGILEGVDTVARNIDIDIIYPIHPRAENRLDEFGLDVSDRIRLVKPLNYLDFLKLQDNAALILTDSGGIQEEACILGVPCVTLRDSTERPETLSVGANRVVGTDPDTIFKGAIQMSDISEGSWGNPFGDGYAAERILDTVLPEAVASTRVQI